MHFSADMDTVPDYPVEVILSHLQVKDLLACSAVSIGWRSAVNCDYVWKKICFKEANAETIYYLKTVSPTVQPVFQEPESEDLEPLCFWRVMYLKIQHIRNNWKTANHTTHQVTGLAYNIYDLKIANNVFVANVNDSQCEVWDIRKVPKKLETLNCALKNSRGKSMILIIDQRLVVVQDSLLQIYNKSDKHFKLSFRRLFNRPEEDSKDIPNSVNIDEWYSSAVQRRPAHLQVCHVGKFFIGLAQNGSFANSTFHVWDTATGSKLREEHINQIQPDNKDIVYNVMFCQPKSDLSKILVCVHHIKTSVHNNGEICYTTVYLYSLKDFSFKKLKVLKPHILWIYYESEFFVTIDIDKSKLSVFKISDGEQIVSKRYEEIINPDSVQVFDRYLGFTTGGDLVVLNTDDFDLAFTTGIVKFSSNLFGFDFLFQCWDLVLVASWDDANKIEVWSIKEKKLLSTLNQRGLIFPCNNSAKFFVWNEMITTIYMLQFW